MADDLDQLWKYASVMALVVGALWLWHKVMIDKLELIAEKLERERDDWKHLAIALSIKSGIEVRKDLLPGSTSFSKKD